MRDETEYQFGIPESLRNEAALLYDEAFGAKFTVAVRDEKKRLDLIAESLTLSYAAGAIADGKLVGLAGFQTPRGALTEGMTVRLLLHHLGFLRGLWASVILSLYERQLRDAELLMDGIVVSQRMRGRGIGSKLLQKVKDYARENEFSQVRLDVIDTNSKAQRLYERQGFVPTRTEHFGYLRWLLGFGASTTLVFRLDSGHSKQSQRVPAPA